MKSNLFLLISLSKEDENIPKGSCVGRKKSNVLDDLKRKISLIDPHC
jgi:hypothetical protein